MFSRIIDDVEYFYENGELVGINLTPDEVI
jgi:hypothetical protein